MSIPGPATPSTASHDNGYKSVLRRRPKTNPLVQRNAVRRATSKGPADPSNGLRAPKAVAPPAPGAARAETAAASAKEEVEGEGEGAYTDYPLFASSREMLEGLRYHVMRLNSRRPVDVAQESDFTRPVRLHRRDPRADPTGAIADDADAGREEQDDDDKEREKLEIARAERQAAREANQAQIAPTTKAARLPAFRKKTEQVYRTNDTPEARKRNQLRYEEALPWHLEDFDSKNVWVGNYEEALSECHVMFVVDDKGFHVVPLEKWYRFTSKNHFKALSIEEAEERMAKKYKEPRWVMETQREQLQKDQDEIYRKKARKLFTRSAGAGADDEEDTAEVAPDADDLDYNAEDDFADDEVDILFGGDEEEVKLAEEKIKREQLGANSFGVNEEKDFDEEEQQIKSHDRQKRKQEKTVRKALIKMEKNYAYEDDSESNPYTSSDSESQASTSEQAKDEQGKKADDGKEHDKDKGRPKDDTQPRSGASSKGTNTPSGRPKHSEVSQKLSKMSIKRPGSPMLSETSGNESTRKRQKKQHARGSTAGPDNNGSAPASRHQSTGPAVPSFGSDAQSRRVRRHGSGSDTDGGSVTDGGQRAQRVKLTLGSVRASPAHSPPGSPGPASPSSLSAPAGQADSKNPLAEEIKDKVPPSGLPLFELIQMFRGRIGDKAQFIAMVKSLLRFEKDSKMLYPRGE